MMTIWKYPLAIARTQEVRMPRGALMVSLQMQEGSPTLWAYVNPDAEVDVVVIECYGTGHMIPNEVGWRHFIGTVQVREEAMPLVFHYFLRRQA